MDSHQGHLALAAASNGEVELGERSAASASTPVEEQEAAGPRTDGRRQSGRRRLRVRRLIPRLDVSSVARACTRWMKHPAHLALLAWALCVAASGCMLGLLLLGVLDGAFPRKAVRNRWIEINNQILNALFTLMSIYQHPVLFHHSVLLLRWRPGDAEELRKAYCRKPARASGACRRRERLHMAIVVVLLHVTCFAQYAMCGLYWGFSRKTRPDAAETSLAVVGTVTPVLAGLYMYFSPLGRKREPSVHQEPDEQVSDDDAIAVEAVIAQTPQRAVMASPEWVGGLLDVGDDPTACWLSCLCTFCVFGWNMERLGLGNMHVHAVMFALLCFAPLWVLNVAAMNIRDEAVGDMVGAAGVVLCALGLLYGGFWRARMRRRFGLPGSGACCVSSPSLADYLQWMFCWGCALAQEVRTGNLLDVEADGIHRTDLSSAWQDGGQFDAIPQPLPRENGVKPPCQAGSQCAVAVVTDVHSVQLTDYSPCRGDESPQRREQACSSPAGEMRPPLPSSIPEGEHRRAQ